MSAAPNRDGLPPPYPTVLEVDDEEDDGDTVPSLTGGSYSTHRMVGGDSSNNTISTSGQSGNSKSLSGSTRVSQLFSNHFI